MALQEILHGEDTYNVEASLSIIAETVLLHRQWLLSKKG